MQPWYRNERLRIAAIAIAAGLVLGGLVALAVGQPKLTRFGQPQKSTADAIAGDQPIVAPRTKPKPRAKKAPVRKAKKAEHARRSRSRGRGSAAATPDATATPDGKQGDKPDSAAAPHRTGAAPLRRTTSRRVTSRGVITQPRRRTPDSRPSPDP